MRILMSRNAVIIFFSIFHIYFYWQICYWLRRCSNHFKRRRALYLLPLIPVALGACLMLFGAFMPDHPAKYVFQRFGNIWFGFFAVLGIPMLCMHIFRIIKGIAGRARGTKMPTPSLAKSRACFLTLLGLALAFNIYGLIHAQQVRITREQITIEKTAAGKDGTSLDHLKVALIADFHLGVNSHKQMYRSMVEKINAEEVDLVLVAGDLFNSCYKGLRDPEGYAEILRGIKARYGTYAVFGNHDVEETLLGGFPMTKKADAYRLPEVDQFASDCGFTVLDDEVVTIADGAVVLAGRMDAEKPGAGPLRRIDAELLLSASNKERPVIVLEHEPIEFAALSDAGADLVLAGHTHNGQVFPANFFTRIFNENSYGYKQLHGLQSFVTSGIGYYGPPLRVGTNSEIAILDISFS